MTNQRVRLFVSGRVQGVFFRQSLKAKSIQNNIFGWVKNLPDGRVECVLEGTEANVSKLVKWAHIGPANSIVENVEIHNEEFHNEFSKFDVLY
ncbi:MAG: acylphosphatase [Nitrosopumilus sp.]|jgi:acylphosphatase|nr:MAG: acylphosphatase [Candidatus Nitrosomarinus sp.]GIS74167.1 MAG: acylphosphatase [Nitrosopumilaceae archaeon]|tara:strand:+ start:173 stop:451 length:279 start_codon:yes stop_codon:yes gene_type:complete